MSTVEAVPLAGTADHGDHAHHPELGFWRKYVFSVDHKVIGIQYVYQRPAVPLLRLHADDADAVADRVPRQGAGGSWALWLGGQARPGRGQCCPRFYNELGAMHGTIMVFLGCGAPGRRRLRQLRAPPADRRPPTWRSPKLNMFSYWSFFIGGVIMFAELLPPRRRRAVRLDL